jgi:hypothetical protein
MTREQNKIALDRYFQLFWHSSEELGRKMAEVTKKIVSEKGHVESHGELISELLELLYLETETEGKIQ